ncbi:MAG: tRNA (guanosine(46)-N7)-methyltransferase TrmB [Dactylosporangium sp.]|nr:tRNA (guanosine(46)-N7)-methyltransferase TrmB [Dactylosporangium sp.]NNJ62700.1 tRNA (guanosine(46)-N7)-methyltransferase TrmB [Dactylosporangium sp.]
MLDRPPAGGLRTYHPRQGRVSARHLAALDRFLPRFGVPVVATPTRPPARHPLQPLDLTALYGRAAPVVLEIGSGMGEATAAMAAADPARDYLAVEIHRPGIANLLSLVVDGGLTNVRIAVGDALHLLRHQLAPGTLDAAHIFFPDPWPKTRHHKRRLIRPANVALLASRLRPGGTLRCATDCAPYGRTMLDTLTASESLVNAHDGYAPRPASRPMTKFELRGIDAGRAIIDLVFHRR